MRRDDDLVVIGSPELVHDGRVRVGVLDRAVRMDAGLAQARERRLQAVLRRPARLFAVLDPAGPWLVLRADHVDLDRPLRRARLDGVDQRLADDRLVGYDEQPSGTRLVHSAAAVCGTPARAASCPLKTACRAPGTPSSYGPPTTVGTSSKLKIGGGEDTCHSIVCACHGFAGAGGPWRHELIML